MQALSASAPPQRELMPTNSQDEYLARSTSDLWTIAPLIEPFWAVGGRLPAATSVGLTYADHPRSS